VCWSQGPRADSAYSDSDVWKVRRPLGTTDKTAAARATNYAVTIGARRGYTSAKPERYSPKFGEITDFLIQQLMVNLSESIATLYLQPRAWQKVMTVGRRSGNGVGRINEVTLRRVRLVLGWVTIFGGQTTSVFHQAIQANSASYPQRDGK